MNEDNDKQQQQQQMSLVLVEDFYFLNNLQKKLHLIKMTLLSTDSSNDVCRGVIKIDKNVHSGIERLILI